jgi:hypothetical protein
MSGRASTQTDENALLAAALAYATRGWQVFPVHGVGADGHCSCRRADCASPGKHPHESGGFKRASTDPEKITSWWRRWPEANIGIATGAVSGLLVLDVDGHEGATTVRILGLATPATCVSRTGGGGWHYLFRHPGFPCKCTTGAIGPKVDTRGDGGYIVAPPSRHASGRRYEWAATLQDVPLADAPAWLLHLDEPVGDPQVATPIAAEIAAGTRNTTLTSLAGSMRRRGMSAEAIYAALAVENTTRCVPPLPEEQVRSIAQGMSRYQPGPDPEREGQPAEASGLVAYGVDDILSYRAERIDYFVEQILAPERVTLLAAKPKAGKTTFAFGAVSAMQRGVPFLGFATRAARVLYVSEQNRRTLQGQLRYYHPTQGMLKVVFPVYNPELSWSEVVGQVEALASQMQAEVIVFDTLNALAKVLDENAAAEMLQATAPLKALAAKGYAVLVVVHARKGAADIVDATRGSNALVGDADIILLLECQGDTDARRRTIESISRDASFEKTYLVREGLEFRQGETPRECERHRREDELVELLPLEPDGALPLSSIVQATGLSDKQARPVLEALAKAGRIQVSGPANRKLYSRREPAV